MNYIYWLSQIQHSEKSLVGNQLYILSQLLQYDYAVLPGFVVSNDLLRQFLTDSDDFQSLIQELSESSLSLDVNNYASLQSVASRSRQIINRAVFPRKLELEIFEATQQLNSDYLILEPFLCSLSGQDVINKGFWRSHTCNIHPLALTQTIKAVWSELFTAQSLFYRHKMGFGGQGIGLNILVRPLKDVYAAGIVEIAPDIIKIEAVWGQGQSLTQGNVESDKYYLDRQTGQLLSRNLGNKSYGYRIKRNSPTAAFDRDRNVSLIDCLESYLPNEKQAGTYVLDWQEIAQLFQLTQSILQKQPQIKYFIWSGSKELNRSLEFFITELGDSLLTSINLQSEEHTASIFPSQVKSKALLTGIPASPGKIAAKVFVAEDVDPPLESIPPGSILVAKNITANHIAAIAKVKGIIVETGGKTSHGAIVARELNIPAIVNAVDATSILSNGIEVFLDGDAGVVYPATAAQDLPAVDRSTNQFSLHHQVIGTKLMANISQLQSIPFSLNLPIDGVGLLRSELMLADILADTSSEKWQSTSFQAEFASSLRESLSQFLAAFAPRPVFYRSLDYSTTHKPNSILDNRGTYNYQLDRTLFSLELDALCAIAEKGHHNFNLILPFVRSIEEFKFCYRLIENVGLTDRESFQVWIMAEVPSVIWLLPEYIKAGVQGIAIGTNDLTQLLLGVDREQAHFSQHGLNANHTVVQKAIAKLIGIARDNGIDCCICGQAPAEYPDLIDKLVDWGITAISVEPQAVNQTYKAIARAERRILLDSLTSKQAFS